MSIAVDRIMRLPRGTELRFSWRIRPEWFEASRRWEPGLPEWLPELEGATVSVDDAAAEGCRLRLCAEKVCATAMLTRAGDGSFDCGLHATRQAPEEPATEWNWQLGKLAGMLGGKHDAYLSAPASAGMKPVLRIRYSGQNVEVYALTGAFAHRLAPMLRAMAPAEVKVGELMPPQAFAGPRHAPCGCHGAAA